MKLALLLAALALPLSAPAVSADCAIEGVLCTTELHEGDDCAEDWARGHHVEETTVTAADARVALTEEATCGTSRDSHYVLETTTLDASAAGAEARVEVVDFTDTYFGSEPWHWRGVFASASAGGAFLYAWHDESGWENPTWPDEWCSTGLGTADGEVARSESCPGVAPLALVP